MGHSMSPFMFPTICLVDDWAQGAHEITCHGLAADSKCRVVKWVFDKIPWQPLAKQINKGSHIKIWVKVRHDSHTWERHSSQAVTCYDLHRWKVSDMHWIQMKLTLMHQRVDWQVNWHLNKNVQDCTEQLKLTRSFSSARHDIKHTPESSANTCGNTECQTLFLERFHSGWSQPFFHKASPSDSAVPSGATSWAFYVGSISTDLAL